MLATLGLVEKFSLRLTAETMLQDQVALVQSANADKA